MKNFDSRTYSINDFLEWSANDQLELSPRFQRRSVWTDTARSYLMDTIISGKPMPKVFIRQKINPQTRKSIREVVDGQQRLRTILSYMNDGFVISRKHNPEFGGRYFSQLDEVDEDVQAHLLNYEISVDLLVNMSDPDVLDVFGRLNSYSVTLNEQEKLNANHFGPFKMLADRIAHSYYEFWTKNRIISEQNVLRMLDAQLVADILIAMIEGVKPKKQIKRFYDTYEKEFPHDPEALEIKFRHIMSSIENIFENGLRNRAFRRVHVFYSLFVSLCHLEFGVPSMSETRVPLAELGWQRLSRKLERVDVIFDEDDKTALEREERQFLEDCRRATTDATVRSRRSAFLVSLMTK